MDPPEYAILNPISGSFDLMSESEYETYCKAEKGLPIDSRMKQYLIERGYLYEDREEYQQSLEKAMLLFSAK